MKPTIVQAQPAAPDEAASRRSAVSLRPLHPAVVRAAVSTHRFTTEDGVELALTRFCRAPCDDVVLLAHGLTGATDMFVLAEHRNLVSFLLDNGFTDVWCLDWRGSGRLPYNREPHGWCFDDVALFDMPAAVQEVRRRVGRARLHACCHCASAMAMAMAAAAGVVRDIDSLVCGSVCLYTRVARSTKLRGLFTYDLLRRGLGLHCIPTDLNELAPFSRASLVAATAALLRRECPNAACRLLNYLWGDDSSTLFKHENVAAETHARLPELFGPVPVSYYEQIRKMIWAQTAVKLKCEDATYDRLPADYLAAASGIEVPLLLVSGDDNRLWYDSNELCFAALKRDHPRVQVELEVIPGYGHNDIVFGKSAAIDVFPRIVAFLQRVRGGVG